MPSSLHLTVFGVVLGWLATAGCAARPADRPSMARPPVEAAQAAQAAQAGLDGPEVVIAPVPADSVPPITQDPGPRRMDIEFRDVPAGYFHRIEATLRESSIVRAPLLLQRSEHAATWRVDVAGEVADLEAELQHRLPAGSRIPFRITAPGPEHRIVTFTQGFQ
ncbi:MAG: hypothetical protein AB7O66_16610 [Limisphaerales bacterium]